jgi:hypothetical protein
MNFTASQTTFEYNHSRSISSDGLSIVSLDWKYHGEKRRIDDFEKFHALLDSKGNWSK